LPVPVHLGFELLSSPTSPYGGGGGRRLPLLAAQRSLTEPSAVAAKPDSSPGFELYHHQPPRQQPQEIDSTAVHQQHGRRSGNLSPGFAVAADGPASLGAAGPSPPMQPTPASLASKSALEGVGDSSSVITKKAKGDPTPLRNQDRDAIAIADLQGIEARGQDHITPTTSLPFGKTDTASVLHETIEYIKFLHDQVGALSAPYLKKRQQVPHLKSSGDNSKHQLHDDVDGGDVATASKRDLTGRGLCLVPISSPSPVDVAAAAAAAAARSIPDKKAANCPAGATCASSGSEAHPQRILKTTNTSPNFTAHRHFSIPHSSPIKHRTKKGRSLQEPIGGRGPEGERSCGEEDEEGGDHVVVVVGGGGGGRGGERKEKGAGACDLCGATARVYCGADEATLCWGCDAQVHGANFLVARHARALLCRGCARPTPWRAAGPRLGPTASLCERCVRRGGGGGGGWGGGDEEMAGDGDGREDEDEDEGEGENQVVPWADEAEATPPPVGELHVEPAAGREEQKATKILTIVDEAFPEASLNNGVDADANYIRRPLLVYPIQALGDVDHCKIKPPLSPHILPFDNLQTRFIVWPSQNL
ncbi:hypothetical protein GUJ93_ZPchr0010g8479, partial [Zizania palustris]